MPSPTIADHLISDNAELRNKAFKDALGLILKNQWSSDIGHGCNLFHFVAFAPQALLNSVLPDWKTRLNEALKHDSNKSFDKESDTLAVTEASTNSPKGKAVPAFNKDTPLGIALFCGNRDVANLLMKHGADINHNNATGNTILHLAAASNTLIEELCNQLHSTSFEAKTHTGKTPLDQAKRYGHTEAAQKLEQAHTEKKDALLKKWANHASAENQLSR